MQYSFIITSKILPAVRMTHGSKFADPRAQAYLASQDALRTQLKNQMALNDWPMMPGKTPLAVELQIGTDKMHICDLDNLLKAIQDSANGIVYHDDCWIDKVNVWRYPSKEHQAIFTVWVR